jgi:hypothetical protein
MPDQADAEISMRRALGLCGKAKAQPLRPSVRTADRLQRRHFAGDGEVPVVMVGRKDQASDTPPSPGAPSVTETVLRSEREARQRAERALSEAVAERDLQTRLGHALLERDEARVAGLRLDGEKLVLTAALGTERTARMTAEKALQRALASNIPAKTG